MQVLFSARDALWDLWSPHLRAAMPELVLTRHSDDDPDPARYEAIIYAPNDRLRNFTPYRNARLVQSLWAGVERIAPNPTLTQPLCRMVDPGLAAGMVEYCTGWVLRAHLGMDRYGQDGIWRNDIIPPLAAQRRVCVLGLGALGGAVAQALAGLGFAVTGWSARGRPVEGVTIRAGQDPCEAMTDAEIIVTLLPDTPATQDILNAERLALCAPGAWIINPGRGTLIDDTALLTAMDHGQIGHAVLDVFRQEPLPAEAPYWAHPKVTVTPHIASETRPETAAAVVAENLRRARDGKPLLHLVDRARGY